MFRNQELVAINISDASLEAIVVRQSGQQSAISSWSRIELSEGIIEQGRIVDKDKAKKALQELLQKAQPQKIVAKEAAVTLPENLVFTQIITTPVSLKPAEIKDLLWQKVSEVIPIDPSQMVGDYYLRTTKAGRESLVVATYSQLIDEYIKLLASVNLKVRLFSTESISLVQALSSAPEASPQLILDIGSDQTIAVIASGGTVRESINIAVAGSQFSQALMQSQKISLAEAEKLKAEVGLTAEPSAVVLQRTLQSLLVEVRMLMNYWQKKSGERVAKLVVTGGSSSMPGLLPYLGSNLGLEAQQAVPDTQYKVQGQDQISPKFLPVLGLALSAQAKEYVINFVEPKLRSASKTINMTPSKKEPEKTKIISMKPTRGHIPIGRLIVLVTLFLVACGIFAYIWWQNTPSTNVPVPTTTTDSEQVRELEINLWVSHSVTSESAPNGDYPSVQGVVRDITVSHPINLDANFWQSVTEQVSAENRSDPIRWAPIVSGILGDNVWALERQTVVAQLRPDNLIVIEDILDTTLVTTSPELVTVTYGQEVSVVVTANVRVLALDRQSFIEVAAAPWQAKMDDELSANFAIAKSSIRDTVNEWSDVSLVVVN